MINANTNPKQWLVLTRTPKGDARYIETSISWAAIQELNLRYQNQDIW